MRDCLRRKEKGRGEVGEKEMEEEGERGRKGRVEGGWRERAKGRRKGGSERVGERVEGRGWGRGWKGEGGGEGGEKMGEKRREAGEGYQDQTCKLRSEAHNEQVVRCRDSFLLSALQSGQPGTFVGVPGDQHSTHHCSMA